MDIFNYQLLGLLAAIIVVTALVPRARQLLKTKALETIPTQRLILLAIGSALWIMYGIRDSSAAIVILAIFGFISSCILATVKLRSRSP